MKRALMTIVLLLGLTCGVHGAVELLTNTGFEVNTTGWSANGCSMARYTTTYPIYSGVASCRAYSRNPASDGILRSITSVLNSNGPGYYTFSAYMRIASGSAVGRIQVENNGAWSDITAPITSTGWTKVSGSINMTWSTLTSATFAINTTDSFADLYIDDCSLQKTTVSTPTFSPDGGSHIDSVEVTLACATEGATIGYTLDDSTPTTSSSVYDTPLTLTTNTTVKALAWKTGMINSSVASADFIVTAASQVVMPTITPNGGTYVDSVEVTLASLTEGASLSYTLDGSTPTTNSLLYSTPFTLTSNTTVKVFGWKVGMTDSTLVSANFVVKLATPTLSPNGGSFSDSVEVTLACTSPGATLFYTTDGSDPTTNSAVYSTPLLLTSSTTVKALAWKSGITESAIASALFSSLVATPVIVPDGGPFTNIVEVTLTCATPGATIRFTSDGTTPGTTAGTYITYTGPFQMSGGTVKAYGYRVGDANSAVASATFVNATNEPWAQISVPGRVEAENYNAGANGVTYSDSTSGNSGHLYRADRVDIEFCGEGGYNVGWTAAGEWLTYTLDVTQNNQFDFVFRVASGASGTKTLRAQIDGVDVGSVSFTTYVQNVWTNYFDVMIPGVSVAKGPRQLKVLFDTASFNLNYLDLIPWPPKATVIVVR